ncbi:MAG: peptidoglycan editing factor PgeF [Methylophilaceae bacterium]
MLIDTDLIFPNWPAPANVQALQTTRAGGESVGPYASLNLGDRVGDIPLQVAANRQAFNRLVPSEPLWLKQVHGVKVVDAATASGLPEADAAYARMPHAVCTVMTADCLPVLLCDEAGSVVGAAHAGWRGLLGGVIEATITAMHTSPSHLMAWLGPAIGPQAFEVGMEVRDAFVAQNAQAAQAFLPAPNDKWLADIYLLAKQRLCTMGVDRIYGGDLCTYTDQTRFFSYRRDGITGRMASMIWLENHH